jgi:flavin-dependent dehydrogenase
MRHPASVDVDVVVVGGGPAGAITALLLARLGMSVVLAEHGSRHRHKTCGHCLGPRALPMLQMLGLLDQTRALALGSTDRLAVHAAEIAPLRVSTTNCAEGDAGLLVPRDGFDQMLRDAAASVGADVQHDAPAMLERCHDDGADVRITGRSCSRLVRCCLVVGADGVGSAVARAAGLTERESAGRKYGFSFDGLAQNGADHEMDRGCVHMFLNRRGYLGVVRQADDTMHLAALVSTTADARAADPLEFVRDTGRMHTPLRQMGWDQTDRNDLLNFRATGPMPWRPRAAASGCVALVGDAAGYIEPFTGEGMTWAIESAMALRETLVDHGQRWNDRTATEYAARWQETVRRRQRVCRMLACALERPRVSRWMLRLGNAAPVIARRLVREVVTP